MQVVTKDTNAKIDLNPEVFDTSYNEGLIHQAVVTTMNSFRSGNSAQKTRSEVRGGGAKPWKQKGTGRARAGTIRSPIWRSGGVTFAAKKRDYSQKINKKMYKCALRSIISELNRTGRLIVVADFVCETLKTKDFLAKTQQLELTDALIVFPEISESAYLASRNLPGFEVADIHELDPVLLLSFDQIVMTEAAVKLIEEQLV